VSVRINVENLGFLRSCNGGVAATSTPYVLLLNNDTVVTDRWLSELLDTFARVPEAGLVGSKLLYPNGLLQEAGGVVWKGGAAANYGRMDDPRRPEFNYMRDVDYVSGAAILVKREAWDRVGGFSDELAPAYYEDTDLTMKLRAAGYRVLYQPLSEVIHLEGISSGTDLTSGVKRFQEINRVTFATKWAEALARCGEPGDLGLANVDRAARGRILFYDALTPRPDEDSGSVTTFEYLRLLSELGHRVTFVSEHLEWGGAHARDLQRLGVRVIFYPYASGSKQFIADTIGEYDLAILSRAPIGGPLVPFIRGLRPELPIVFDTVDIHYRRMLREYALTGDVQMFSAAREMKALELNAIRFSDLTLLVSEEERRFLTDEIGAFPSLVIPLILRPAPAGPGFAQRQDVAFVGGYRHTPNVDAVRHLVEDIWPLFREQTDGARLHIIGSHMPPSFSEFAAEDVKLVGYVKDLDSYLADIRLTVAPLRYGAGVKGKVANSLRLGVPAVISPAAAEGMPMVSGRNVLIADNPSGFATEMSRLYADPQLWAQLSAAGRETIENWVGVEPARAKLKAMCAALIEARKQAA
jgi:GT2 family glycosyltransferase